MIKARQLVGNNKIGALTLIELIITATIISILAAISLASMKKVDRPQQLVENATNLVQNYLIKAQVTSLTAGAAPAVCSLRADPASGFAVCDNQAVWSNINGSKIPSRVRVSVRNATNNQITYSLGLLPQGAIVPSNNQIIITIAFSTSPLSNTCYNTIAIWPNGVLDITNSATSDRC